MPFIIADRVRETSTTVGTGSIALGGAVIGYQSFDAVMDTADTTFYVFADQAGGPNWEVGIGTFTAPSTLARTTIISSSNGGSIVNFGSGTKDVFISLPASKTNVDDQPNFIEVNSSTAALRITQTGTGNALLVEDSANPDSSPFVIDASGNVGVGTTTPTAPLDVNGNVAITGTARRITGDFSNATVSNRVMFQTSTVNGNTQVRVIPNGTATTATLQVGNSSDPNNQSGLSFAALSTYLDINAIANGTGSFLPLTFSLGGSERMRITTGGLVGIGTSSPAANLDVATSGAVTAGNVVRVFNSTDGASAGVLGLVKFGSTATTYGPYTANTVGVNSAFTNLLVGTETAHNAIFYTGNVERMRIDTAGNVGIGTSSPSERLTVNSAIGVRGSNFASLSYFGSSVNPTGVYTGLDSGGGYVINVRDAGYQAFSTSNSERMRIDASGNVGIGTSSPSTLLHLYNASVPAFRISNNTTALNTYVDANFCVTGSITSHPYIITTNNAERMRIDTSGNVSVGNTVGLARLRVVAGGFVNAPVLGNVTNYPAFISAADFNYGLGIGVSSATGNVWLQAQRADSAVAYDIGLNPAGGNVGVGTLSPGARLAVAVGAADSTNGILVSGGAVNKTVMLRPSMGAGSNNNIVQAGDGGIIFDGGTVDTGAFVIAPWANATSGIRIVGSTGNVGIGLSSPTARLHVAGTIQSQSGSSVAQMYSDGGAAYFTSVGAFPSLFLTNGSERMRISGSGADVSIGTSSIFYASANRSTMTIVGATDALLALGGGGAASGYVYGSAATMNLTADSRTLSLQATGSNIIQFITGVSERMRLDASGNLGIGTSSPNFNGATGTVCHINNSAASSWALSHYTNGTTGAAAADGLIVGLVGDGSNAYIYNYEAADILFGTSGAERVRITSGGNVGIGTASPGVRLDVSGSVRAAGSLTVGFGGQYQAGSLYSDGNWGMIIRAAQVSPALAQFLFVNSGGSELLRIDNNTNLFFNSGYGSVAVAYGCRAWVNFNGTGTVAIRASGNVSSITDNNTGDYTVNFTTSMPDANYSAVVSGGMSGAGAAYGSASSGAGGSITTTSSVRINTRNTAGTLTDGDTVMVAIIR